MGRWLLLLLLCLKGTVLYAQPDLLLHHAGKKVNRFLHYRSPAQELIIISGRAGAYEALVFDEQLQLVQNRKFTAKMNSLEGFRLLSLVGEDTLTLFLFSKENNKLYTYTLVSDSLYETKSIEHYFGSNMKYIAARILEGRLHFYFVPNDQNRLLIYATSNGARFDLSEYRIQIPGFYRRASEDPFTETRYYDRLYVSEIRSTMHDPLVSLAFKVKLYFRGPEIILMADDKDALHVQRIHELSQEAEVKRHLIRLEGMKPNQPYFMHSLPGPGSALYRLSRYNRNYWLHRIDGDSVSKAMPLFAEGGMLNERAYFYTESLENGKERELNDRNHKLRHLRRLLNDGTCLLRIDEQSPPDTLLFDIGSFRFMESYFTGLGRGNSLQLFDFGYDPWYSYNRPTRLSSYFLYDHLKVQLLKNKLSIIKSEKTDSRRRFMETQEWLKEHEAPVHMEWTELNGNYYILYLDRKGDLRYRISQ